MKTEQQKIEVIHNGIAITYDDSRDLFTFELRGRCRSAPSIGKAKEIIDKPAPEQKKPFQRIKAWYEGNYGRDGWRQVEITSIAEKSWGSYEVWVLDGKQRRKLWANSVYPVNPTTDAQVKEHAELRRMEREYSDKASKLKERMKHYQIPEDEDADA